MAISLAEVSHIAKLAKLSFNDEEMTRLASELDSIVGYVEQLKDLNVDDVPATSHVLDLSNVFREDKVEDALPVEDLMRNAPESKMNMFSVRKVIG